MGDELAEMLAVESEYPLSEGPERKDLARMASYYEIAQFDRGLLRKALRSVFVDEQRRRRFEPGPIHRLLANNPTHLLIVTTNYDDLIEQAFEAIDKPFAVLVHPIEWKDRLGIVLFKEPDDDDYREVDMTDPPEFMTNKYTLIYKMHGTCDVSSDVRDHFLITEDDYATFLHKMPTPEDVLHMFRERRFLFLGYGLRDWNFRVMMVKLASQSPDPGKFQRAWAVQLKPTEEEVRLLMSRNITILKQSVDEFSQRIS